jgi:hypothetical protein
VGVEREVDEYASDFEVEYSDKNYDKLQDIYHG